MIFIPISTNIHAQFHLFAEKETKQFLLAKLKMSDIQTGCYVYFGTDRQVLYVGKSETLHARLLNHTHSSKGFEKLFPEWQSLGIIFSDNPLLTEKELIRQLNPSQNKQL